MAYNNAIPQPSDKIKNSQPPFLMNFDQISTLVGINHVNFNVADAGKHYFVQFPVQNPAPVTIAGEVGLYSFTNPNTGVPELYVKRQSNLPAGGIPMTATGTLSPTAGWSYLPSGILIKWGRSSVGPSGSVNIDQLSGGPAFTTIYNVQITVERDNGATDPNRATAIKDLVGPATTLRFYRTTRITLGDAICAMQYFAIGV